LEKFFEDLKETSKAKKVEFREGKKEVIENLKIKVEL